VFLLCLIPASPQNLADLLSKAPPDIDKALRDTIAKFYQAHVEGKFRAADAYVAEDSKDIFFGADKRRCRSFEIIKVNYTDNFTRASAVVTCDTDVLMPMAGKIAVKMPLASFWKLQNGRWFWYAPPSDPNSRQTPFGSMHPGNAASGATTASGSGSIFAPVSLDAVAGLVKADREEVRFDPASPASELVTITNRMPGSVTLSLEDPPSAPGLELKLERTELKAGEQAHLVVRFNPAGGRPKADLTVYVLVMPTQQRIPVRIVFPAASTPAATR